MAAPPSAFLLELARRLKAVRVARGQTLQEVYDETGIHVARLETGRRSAAFVTVALLCRYYHVELAKVVEGLEQLLAEELSQP
jgi:transcriptional regulator with XRE-family HTH domain